MSTYRFIDESGTERLIGELEPVGGATGDVPTQGADGKLSQAPGGGSQPAARFGADRIVFSRDGADGAVVLYHCDAAGKGVLQITNEDPNFYDYVGSFEPTVRQYVVFTRYYNVTPPLSGHSYDVCTVNVDDPTDLTVVTDTMPLTAGKGAYYGRYSPDGTEIVFVAENDDGGVDIWKMNADGSGRVQLTNIDGSFGPPVWSPDGTKIAAVNAGAGSADPIGLYTLDSADGGNLTKIAVASDFTNGTGLGGDCSWGANDRIAVQLTQVSGYRIWTVTPTGADPTAISPNDGDLWLFPYWVSDASKLIVVMDTGDARVLSLDGSYKVFPIGTSAGTAMLGGDGNAGDLAVATYVDPISGTFNADLVEALQAAGYMEATP